MGNNPDVYLLYEYMKKNAFTVRVKVNLSETVDEALLAQAAGEAFTRFPYFSVRVELDEKENYVLQPNRSPIAVLPETDCRLVLGSAKVNGHLFAVTWKENAIWFNFAHCICGGFGALFWIKTTLYQYLTKKYGQIRPPVDLKAVGSPVDETEYAYPDPDSFPDDEPVKRYEEKSSTVGMTQDILYFLNPLASESYYYQVDLDSEAFMAYAKQIDGTPNTVLTAIMLKTVCRYYSIKKDRLISAKIADDYRKDIGCGKSYRDYVRFIHVKYDREMAEESIEKLSQRARGAILLQMQPENSFEWYRRIAEARKGIDEQPNLKSRINYAQKHSIYKSDARDTYTVSYVGRTDWGGMADYITGVYAITDGNLMLEVNALPDKICVSYQVFDKDSKPLDLFLQILREEKLPYTVSERMVRYMPDIQLPKPKAKQNKNPGAFSE